MKICNLQVDEARNATDRKSQSASSGETRKLKFIS